MNTVKSKLRWRCRRGVKELDIIFETYLTHHYDSADPTEQLKFSELLELEDPALLAMLIGNTNPTETQQLNLIKKLRALLNKNS